MYPAPDCVRPPVLNEQPAVSLVPLRAEPKRERVR